MPLDVWTGPDGEAVAQEAARRFVAYLTDTLREHGHATIALAGGATPRRMYELLADADVDWSGVHVWLTDERAVPDTDPESNLRMVREALLDHVAIPGDNVHAFDGGAANLEAEAMRASVELLEFAGSTPRLDAAVLGIGEDGHTASLFLASSALAIRAPGVVAVRKPLGRGARLTLTLPVLRAVGEQFILAVGARKAEAVAGLLAGNKSLPIVLATRGCRATLFADSEAACDINGTADGDAAGSP